MRLFLALIASLAACCSTATAGNWYASAFGGVNMNDVIDVPGFVDKKDGVVVGAALGHKIAAIPGLRIEGEASYRTNDVDLIFCYDTLTARHETTAFMFNAAFDFGSGPIRPYVLAGAGYAHTQASTDLIPIVLEASDVAYQAGAGVQMELGTTGTRLGLGYRFFQGPKLAVGPVELSNGQNESAIASLSFDF